MLLGFAVASLMLSGCGFVTASGSTPSVPPYLRHAPTGAAAADAAQAIRTATGFGRCLIVRRDPALDLPTPFQRCAHWGPSQVTYLVKWQSPDPMGLVFSAGAVPTLPDICLRRLGGSWWAAMDVGAMSKGEPCAPKFVVEPGWPS